MYYNIPLQNKTFTELNPVMCGYQRCAPGYSFGPAVRSHYLIHCVIEGEGRLYKDGKNYPVKAGQAFLIKPDEITVYTADEKRPWYYIWIEFNGSLANQLKVLKHPVFEMDTNLFLNIRKAKDVANMREEYLAGQLFLILAEIFKEKKNHNYVEIAENYLVSNYMYPVRIGSVAASIGLDRRYLSRIFKQKTGRSMQQFLLDKRIKEAKKLLSAGISVSTVARMVGYDDPFNFSKLFKASCGMAPKKFASQNRKSD